LIFAKSFSVALTLIQRNNPHLSMEKVQQGDQVSLPAMPQPTGLAVTLDWEAYEEASGDTARIGLPRQVRVAKLPLQQKTPERESGQAHRPWTKDEG
jgi:hypothetical protein